MNKSLRLPAFQFPGDSAVSWQSIEGNPPIVGAFPIYGQTSKNWSGVPIRASDAPSIPVAWTPELLRFNASGVLGGDYFHSVADYLAVAGAFVPTRWFAEKGSPISSPRLCIIRSDFSLSDLESGLAPIAAKLQAKKVMVVIQIGAFGFSDATGDLPLSLASLPPSGYSAIFDNVVGSPRECDLPDCDPIAWKGGWYLGINVYNNDASNNDTYYVVGVTGGSVTSFDVLANAKAHDIARFKAISPSFEKFGFHLLAIQGVSPDDIAVRSTVTPELNDLVTQLGPFGLTASNPIHNGDFATVQADLLVETVAKITSFFEL